MNFNEKSNSTGARKKTEKYLTKFSQGDEVFQSLFTSGPSSSRFASHKKDNSSARKNTSTKDNEAIFSKLHLKKSECPEQKPESPYLKEVEKASYITISESSSDEEMANTLQLTNSPQPGSPAHISEARSVQPSMVVNDGLPTDEVVCISDDDTDSDDSEKILQVSQRDTTTSKLVSQHYASKLLNSLLQKKKLVQEMIRDEQITTVSKSQVYDVGLLDEGSTQEPHVSESNGSESKTCTISGCKDSENMVIPDTDTDRDLDSMQKLASGKDEVVIEDSDSESESLLLSGKETYLSYSDIEKLVPVKPGNLQSESSIKYDYVRESLNPSAHEGSRGEVFSKGKTSKSRIEHKLISYERRENKDKECGDGVDGSHKFQAGIAKSSFSSDSSRISIDSLQSGANTEPKKPFEGNSPVPTGQNLTSPSLCAMPELIRAEPISCENQDVDDLSLPVLTPQKKESHILRSPELFQDSPAKLSPSKEESLKLVNRVTQRLFEDQITGQTKNAHVSLEAGSDISNGKKGTARNESVSPEKEIETASQSKGESKSGRLSLRAENNSLNNSFIFTQDSPLLEGRFQNQITSALALLESLPSPEDVSSHQKEMKSSPSSDGLTSPVFGRWEIDAQKKPGNVEDEFGKQKVHDKNKEEREPKKKEDARGNKDKDKERREGRKKENNKDKNLKDIGLSTLNSTSSPKSPPLFIHDHHSTELSYDQEMSVSHQTGIDQQNLSLDLSHGLTDKNVMLHGWKGKGTLISEEDTDTEKSGADQEGKEIMKFSVTGGDPEGQTVIKVENDDDKDEDFASEVSYSVIDDVVHMFGSDDEEEFFTQSVLDNCESNWDTGEEEDSWWDDGKNEELCELSESIGAQRDGSGILHGGELDRTSFDSRQEMSHTRGGTSVTPQETDRSRNVTLYHTKKAKEMSGDKLCESEDVYQVPTQVDSNDVYQVPTQVTADNVYQVSTQVDGTKEINHVFSSITLDEDNDDDMDQASFLSHSQVDYLDLVSDSEESTHDETEDRSPSCELKDEDLIQLASQLECFTDKEVDDGGGGSTSKVDNPDLEHCERVLSKHSRMDNLDIDSDELYELSTQLDEGMIRKISPKSDQSQPKSQNEEEEEAEDVYQLPTQMDTRRAYIGKKEDVSYLSPDSCDNEDPYQFSTQIDNSIQQEDKSEHNIKEATQKTVLRPQGLSKDTEIESDEDDSDIFVTQMDISQEGKSGTGVLQQQTIGMHQQSDRKEVCEFEDPYLVETQLDTVEETEADQFGDSWDPYLVSTQLHDVDDDQTDIYAMATQLDPKMGKWSDEIDEDRDGDKQKREGGREKYGENENEEEEMIEIEGSSEEREQDEEEDPYLVATQIDSPNVTVHEVSEDIYDMATLLDSEQPVMENDVKKKLKRGRARSETEKEVFGLERKTVQDKFKSKDNDKPGGNKERVEVKSKSKMEKGKVKSKKESSGISKGEALSKDRQQRKHTEKRPLADQPERTAHNHAGRDQMVPAEDDIMMYMASTQVDPGPSSSRKIPGSTKPQNVKSGKLLSSRFSGHDHSESSEGRCKEKQGHSLRGGQLNRAVDSDDSLPEDFFSQYEESQRLTGIESNAEKEESTDNKKPDSSSEVKRGKQLNPLAGDGREIEVCVGELRGEQSGAGMEKLVDVSWSAATKEVNRNKGEVQEIRDRAEVIENEPSIDKKNRTDRKDANKNEIGGDKMRQHREPIDENREGEQERYKCRRKGTESYKDREMDHERNKNRERDHERDKDREKDYKRNRDLDRERDQKRSKNRERNHESNKDRERKHGNSRDRECGHERRSERKHEWNKDRKRDHEKNKERKTDHERNSERSHGRNENRDSKRNTEGERGLERNNDRLKSVNENNKSSLSDKSESLKQKPANTCVEKTVDVLNRMLDGDYRLLSKYVSIPQPSSSGLKNENLALGKSPTLTAEKLGKTRSENRNENLVGDKNDMENKTSGSSFVAKVKNSSVQADEKTEKSDSSKEGKPSHKRLSEANMKTETKRPKVSFGDSNKESSSWLSRQEAKNLKPKNFKQSAKFVKPQTSGSSGRNKKPSKRKESSESNLSDIIEAAKRRKEMRETLTAASGWRGAVQTETACIEDAEVPCTQDVMELGLPMLSNQVLVNKNLEKDGSTTASSHKPEETESNKECSSHHRDPIPSSSNVQDDNPKSAKITQVHSQTSGESSFIQSAITSPPLAVLSVNEPCCTTQAVSVSSARSNTLSLISFVQTATTTAAVLTAPFLMPTSLSLMPTTPAIAAVSTSVPTSLSTAAVSTLVPVSASLVTASSSTAAVSTSVPTSPSTAAISTSPSLMPTSSFIAAVSALKPISPSLMPVSQPAPAISTSVPTSPSLVSTSQSLVPTSPSLVLTSPSPVVSLSFVPTSPSLMPTSSSLMHSKSSPAFPHAPFQPVVSTASCRPSFSDKVPKVMSKVGPTQNKGILKDRSSFVPSASSEKRIGFVNFDLTKNMVKNIEPRQHPGLKQLHVNTNQRQAPLGTRPAEPLLTEPKFLSRLLNWNPSWLAEYDKMSGTKRSSPPPLLGAVRSEASQLRLYYENIKGYQDITLNALFYEVWEMMFQDWKKQPRSDHSDVKMVLEGFRKKEAQDQYYEQYVKEGLLFINVRGISSQSNRSKLPNTGDLLTTLLWGIPKGKPEKVPEWVTQFAFVKLAKYSPLHKCKELLHTQPLLRDLPECKSRDSEVFTLTLVIRHKAILDNKKLWSFQKLSNLTSVCRQVKALVGFVSTPLCQELLKPDKNSVFFHGQLVEQNTTTGTQPLNKEQSEAVTKIKNAVLGHPNDCSVFLLQGPPGTGKSHTIMALLHTISYMSNFKSRMCLATPSNAAVDELARRVLKLNNKLESKKLQKLNLVRVGNPSSIHPEVQPFHLDKLVDRQCQQYVLDSLPEGKSIVVEMKYLQREVEDLKKSLQTDKGGEAERVAQRLKLRDYEKDYQSMKSQLRQPTPRERYNAQCHVLNRAHVVCGTLSSFGSEQIQDILLRSEDNRKRSQPFTCLIIDEATQATEMDCLIPLQFGMKKLICVGDHEQLPATVLSQKACDLKLNRSLFERLHTYFEMMKQNQPSLSSPMLTLVRQYRMHEEILSFPNQYFYQNRLVSDDCVHTRKFPLRSYLIFDIQEGAESRDVARSISNKVEATCVAFLCQLISSKLKAFTSHAQCKIGVICPYAEQKNTIVNNLRHLVDKKFLSSLDHIEVNTVDSFQGQERDVVIVSCVRAQSNPNTIGFVADKKRMNVALTRAKQALYIVGHFQTLSTSDLWGHLYQDAQKRCALVTISHLRQMSTVMERVIGVADSRTEKQVR